MKDSPQRTQGMAMRELAEEVKKRGRARLAIELAHCKG